MKLGLGTVQFGLDYGVSNQAGRVPADEVRRMLALAAQAGIRVLDTAHLYGDSEQMIGESLPPGAAFRIVTKTPRFGAATITEDHADELEAAVAGSRNKLRCDRLDGLLLHHAADALAEGSARLFERMARLKERGWVDKVGVSVYDPDELERIMDLHAIDIVQLPFNVLDQRLLQRPELVRRLRDRRIEVHARSVFMQGLLLMDPAAIDPYFTPWRPLLEEFQRRAVAASTTPLALALRFALHARLTDVVIVGACSGGELSEIANAADSRFPLPVLADLASDDASLVNPARWPARRQAAQH